MGLGGAAAAAGIVMYLGLVLVVVTPVAWWVAVKLGDHSGTGRMPVRGLWPKGWRWLWPERSPLVVGLLTVGGVVAAWQVFRASDASLIGQLVGVLVHHVVVVGGTVAVRLWGLYRHDWDAEDSALQAGPGMARRAAVLWLVGVVAVGSLGGLWVYRLQTHQRHTTGLLVQALEVTGLPAADAATGTYHRRHFDNCSTTPDADPWYADIAVYDRGHELADWAASTVAVATHYERRGWRVSRWVRTSPDSGARIVRASRGNDVLIIRIGRREAVVHVLSGPCVTDGARDPVGNREYRPVDAFS